MQLEICPDRGFLKVGATGVFSLEAAKRTFVEMLEAVAWYKAQKVLFDGRRLSGEPRFLERFYYGEFAARTVAEFADRGVSRGTQFAYVLQEPVLDPERFGENVAVNRGMLVKVFDNPEEALVWLRIAPAHRPDAGGQ